MTTSFGERFAQILSERDISERAIGRHIGVTGAAVNQWKHGLTYPTYQNLQALSAILGVPVEALAGIPATLPGAVVQDVPVLRTVRRRDNRFSLVPDSEPTGLARRWCGMPGAGLAAIAMTDDAMAPWRERGELVYVQRGEAPERGTHAMIEFKCRALIPAPLNACIRKLIDSNPDMTEVMQYNPSIRSVIPTKTIETIVRVVEWAEVLGM